MEADGGKEPSRRRKKHAKPLLHRTKVMRSHVIYVHLILPLLFFGGQSGPLICAACRPPNSDGVAWCTPQCHLARFHACCATAQRVEMSQFGDARGS